MKRQPLSPQQQQKQLVEATLLRCPSCSRVCAIDAKFCCACGHKLKNVFAVLRTKLPSLDQYHSKDRLHQMLSKESELKSMIHKSPPKNPPRLSPIETTANKKTKATETSKKETSPPRHRCQEETNACVEQDNAIKEWMVSTRKTLEALLEMNRCMHLKEAIDASKYHIAATATVTATHAFHALCHRYAIDTNLEEKCHRMLERMHELVRDLHAADTTETNNASISPVNRRKHKKLEIPDAEVVIKNPKGQKMYFKARVISKTLADSVSNLPFQQEPPKSAMIVPHRMSFLSNKPMQIMETSPKESKKRRTCLVRGLIARRWSVRTLFVRICRIHGHRVIVRVEEEEQEQDEHEPSSDPALLLHIYRPHSSLIARLRLPLRVIHRFLLPPGVIWYRRAEIRPSAAVHAHYIDCFMRYITPRLHWRQHHIELKLRPLFRMGRCFSYRSFASFFGVLEVYLDDPIANTENVSLRIVYLNVSTVTPQRQTLQLTREHLALCLGHDVYQKYVQLDQDDDIVKARASATAFYRLVCQKLYLEYSTRTFEIVFPGKKPRGCVRQHPMEHELSRTRATQEEHERQQWMMIWKRCSREAASIGLRRLEQYFVKQQAAKKQAIVRIQARARGLLARKQVKMCDLSATMIQHAFRHRKQQERLRRRRQTQQQNATGTSFHFATRLQGTFLLVRACLDVIDAETNWLDVRLYIVHPITSTKAVMVYVPHAHLLQILCCNSLRSLNRRTILEKLLASDGFQVFRSATNNVLVVQLTIKTAES